MKKQSTNCHPILLLVLLHIGFIAYSQSTSPLVVNAGIEKNVCINDSVKLGGNPTASGGSPPYSYLWTPSANLNSSTIANPTSQPTSNTKYTVTVTDSLGKSVSGSVNIVVHPLPTVIAGANQTIQSGTYTLLEAKGASIYVWYPTLSLTNQNTSAPRAEPIKTTMYYVIGADANGCLNYDSTLITVIPNDTLIFFNTFTPNKDQVNDVFFIGNIGQYPNSTLEVYNRNGKLVFRQSPYTNDWEGTSEGAELPTATYYYILFSGKGKDKFHGSVTIIR